MSENLSYNGFGSLVQNEIAAGAFQFLIFVAVKDIDTFGTTTHIDGSHSGFVPKSGSQLYTAILPPTGRGYSEEQKDGPGGQYQDINVTGLIPFIGWENEMTLRAMQHERYVLLVQLPGQIVKVIGTPDNPARFRQSLNTGTTIKGIATTDVQFYWQWPEKPPMLSPSDYTWLYRSLLD